MDSREPVVQDQCCAACDGRLSAPSAFEAIVERKERQEAHLLVQKYLAQNDGDVKAAAKQALEASRRNARKLQEKRKQARLDFARRMQTPIKVVVPEAGGKGQSQSQSQSQQTQKREQKLE